MNARLRRVVAVKAELIAGQETLLAARRKQLDNQTEQRPRRQRLAGSRSAARHLRTPTPGSSTTPQRTPVQHLDRRPADLGVLHDWHGYLVRDDYAGWHQFDAHLAGVQLGHPVERKAE